MTTPTTTPDTTEIQLPANRRPPEGVEDEHGVRVVDLSKPFLPDWTVGEMGDGWTPVRQSHDAYETAPKLVEMTRTKVAAIYADEDLTLEAKRRRASAAIAEAEHDLAELLQRTKYTAKRGADAEEQLAGLCTAPALSDLDEARRREQREVFDRLPEEKRSALLVEAMQRGNDRDLRFLQALLAGPVGYEPAFGSIQMRERAEDLVARFVDPSCYSRAKSFPVAADLARTAIESSTMWLNGELEGIDEGLEGVQLPFEPVRS